LNNINIIGAGASGLFCSIILAKKGYRVNLFEKNTKAGRKILATGNGKCNISNQNLSLENFHSGVKKFPNFAIDKFGYKELENFFKNIGLELTTTSSSTKLFPMSLQASSVVDILYNEAILNGVKFYFNSFITDIKYKNNYYNISIDDKTYSSKYLIIATGSGAMKKLGSSDSGYTIAKQFKHNIVPLFASLVQLNCKDKDIHNLSGVKVNSSVKLYIDKKEKQYIEGDVLFTSYGVSGNAILDISRNCSKYLYHKNKVELVIDILPLISKDKLVNMLNKRKEILKDKDIKYLLMSVINSKLIDFIYKKANIKRKNIKELNKKDILNIVYTIKHIDIQIESTKGFESAEVVAGGVDVKDIDFKTMQSKLQKGLFFCGEVLDVDGNCGGYNLHWAFSSAFICANSI